MHPGVRYELQELEKLISSGDQTIRDEKHRNSLKDAIKQEVERIKQTFIHEVFTFEDERHLERYIQYHQRALIQLMDKAALFINSDNPVDRNRKQFYELFYTGLEELLLFVERHFTKYFDQDAKAPEGYIDIARKDARTNIRKLQKALAAKETDQRLVNLLLHILKKIFDSKPDLGITYRKVMYAKEVQKELFRLIERESEIQDWDDELRQVMYYLNYNSVKVLTYHAHYISSLLDQSETRAEKIEKLSFVLKKINQSQVKPGIRYNQNGSPLKDQLNIYIMEEIDYQERLQQSGNGSTDRASESFLSGFKLKFQASVSQLAYLLRIFMETKFILNNNLTHILHFLVKYVITKRSETISYGSFRSKFYSVETGTKESVRNMLSAMISYIDKN
ncbi:MAG TPA: hypothetical protein PLV21_04075 [Cyclobacteriaceae bacterium]|nr:hypothetical protein [Cyclobacteriaceae bacterium]HRJ81038.1 hypothetical protein [Cyclobacteriaceae bacterium]